MTGKTNDGSRLEVTKRRFLQGTAAAGALSLVGTTGAAADGPTTVVVRAEDAEVPLVASSSVVDELQATAATSQAPIVEYVEATEGLSVLTQFWLANAVLVEVDPDVVDLDALAAQTGVEAVHPNFAFALPAPTAGTASTDDSGVTYGLDGIDAPAAWEAFGTRGEGARVAVLDTGVDPTHPDIDIAPEHFAEFDGEGNQVDSAPHDSDFHGTHVSGTVVGGDASRTAIGVAPDATLLHGLVLSGGGGTFAQIVAGMEWAVQNAADVINMSLGAAGFFAEFIEPVRNAERAGVVVVTSSGNDGPGTSSTPANVFDAVAVGATDEAEAVAEFSSGEVVDTEDAWGHLAPDEWPDSYVVPDLSGPGVDVLSAVPADANPPVPVIDDQWARVSGTSMASPHVAGVAALVAAAGDDVDPERAEAALSTTARKPEGAPPEPDTRYGRGIVDALHAVSRVGADSGVTGTVTDADGAPIAGATVELDGFPAETGSDGEYTLRALAGTYEVTVDAFGYADASATVEVAEGFTTRDFALGDELAAAVAAGQPEGLQAGESFEVRLRVANADSVTVSVVGDYEGDAALLVDGEAARFGEPTPIDPAAESVTVTVETDERGFGDLGLEHVLAGLGETVTVTTGPTSVFEQPVPVAVVDVEAGDFGTDVLGMLERELPPRFDLARLAPDAALAAARAREHEAYVVQNLGDEDLAGEFSTATADPAVGVVYLDQFGDASDAVSQRSAATGDPRRTFEEFTEGFAPPVEYAVRRDHPTFDGIADPGQSVELYEPDPVFAGQPLGGFHANYEDFDGEVAGMTLANTAVGVQETGEGFGVDDLSRTVLASSLGLSSLVGRRDFTAAGRRLLANATAFAARTPAVEVVEAPPDRIAPGETATLIVEAEDLLELTVGVSGLQFVTEADLALTVDGEPATFDEPIAFDDPRDGRIEIAIEAGADGIGEFAFDTRFVTLGPRDREVETAVTFRPTTIYESPIDVPRQIEDLQAAVDFVRPGDAVVVADGTYEVDEPDRGFQAGLYVGTPGITIRGADGATPEIVHARDLPAPNVINVDADDVTLENLAANVVDGEIDEKNAIGQAIRIDETVSGTTVRDVTAAATTGVFLDADVSAVHVEDVTVFDSPIGVGTDLRGGPVADVTVVDVTVEEPNSFGFGGVFLHNADRVRVVDCDIEYEQNYDAGVLVFGDFFGSEDNVVRNNTIVGPDDDDPFPDTDNGIYVDGAEATIEDNTIVDAHVGVRVAEFGFGFDPPSVFVGNNTIENAATGFQQVGDLVAFERNTVAAETGLHFDGGFFGLDADAVIARFNDLSGTDVPFVGEPASGFTSPDGPFDARLNFLGDRAYGETIVDGEVAYDPFLTVPPGEADLPEPTAIGTDLYLDPGESYGLGVPGPTDLTIYEILGVDGFKDVPGDLEFFNPNSGKFQRVTGRGRLAQVDTLAAFRVTPEEGIRAVVDFRRQGGPPGRGGTPPGLRDDEPGQTRLQADRNFVAAPAYGDAGEVFDHPAIAAVEDTLASPGGQLADADRQAFTGYLVRATEDVVLETDLDAYDPTMVQLYEGLGLDPVIHENPGPGGSSTAAEVTVADVIEAAPDEEAATEALTALLGSRLSRSVGPDADADAGTLLEELQAITEAATADVPEPDRELVADAAARAVGLALSSRFGADAAGEAHGEFDSRAARTHSEATENAAPALPTD